MAKQVEVIPMCNSTAGFLYAFLKIRSLRNLSGSLSYKACLSFSITLAHKFRMIVFPTKKE